MDTFPQNLKKQIIPLRGYMGLCHLLIEEDKKSAVLIDTGLFGELWMLKLALYKNGLRMEDIRAILMTHGHLDHSGNLEVVKRLSGAKVYAHPLEQEIINGKFKYEGVNTWCGRLESLGRKVLRTGKPVDIDIELKDGLELPYFGGIRTIHLPGHTLGHCGFLCLRHNLLFSGDLFSSYTLFSHIPPPILNTAPKMILPSLRKVWELEAKYIVPQHYDFFCPVTHKKRFEEIFYKELEKSKRQK
jgi:glyoxylase-like metal-dependent hydrolase (beta-lactamase superfamily II)